MDEPRRHSIAITAQPADIDELGHVSNLVYVRWVQDVAQAHSTAVGWDSAAYRDHGAVFVVRRHEIDYVQPVFAGEALTATTWIEWSKAVSSERRTEIARDGQVVARASTLWAFVDMSTGKPRKIPDTIRGAFGMLAVALLLAACGGGGSAKAPPISPDMNQIEGGAFDDEGNAEVPAATGNVILDEHNRYRAAHCAAPLAWSDELAATAQAWANRCEFEHSDTPYGENLAMGTSGYLPPEAVVEMWYAEKAEYDFANGGFSGNTGHFTQVVWRGTTQVGCGMAQCDGQDLWVCNYDPSGNYEGQYQDNVLPEGCD